ncbi:MAG: alanine racemase, partial [Solirubrobacterales bacterium]
MAEQTTVPTSLRRAVAHVDLAAISANVRLLRSKLSPSTELCAVVKADGYGHGIERVAVGSAFPAGHLAE